MGLTLIRLSHRWTWRSRITYHLLWRNYYSSWSWHTKICTNELISTILHLVPAGSLCYPWHSEDRIAMLLFPWGSGALLASKRLSSRLTRYPRSLVIGMQRSIKLLAHSRCSVEPWKAADSREHPHGRMCCIFINRICCIFINSLTLQPLAGTYSAFVDSALG